MEPYTDGISARLDGGEVEVEITGDVGGYNSSLPAWLDAKQCRNLAAWLTRAADILDEPLDPFL
jgi:hypothetical protein